jgi:hypothetical protein
MSNPTPPIPPMKSWVSPVIVLMAAIAYSFFSKQSIRLTDAFRLFGEGLVFAAVFVWAYRRYVFKTKT